MIRIVRPVDADKNRYVSTAHLPRKGKLISERLAVQPAAAGRVHVLRPILAAISQACKRSNNCRQPLPRGRYGSAKPSKQSVASHPAHLSHRRDASLVPAACCCCTTVCSFPPSHQAHRLASAGRKKIQQRR